MASIRGTGSDGGSPYKITVKRAGERWYFTRDSWAAAQKVAGFAEDDLDNGRDPYDRYRISRRRDEMTVEAWASEWQADRGVELNTAYKVAGHIRNHIVPKFGTVELGEVRKTSVQRWIKVLERSGLKAGTVRGIYATFAALMADAVDDGLIDSTPCVRITLPEDDSEEGEWLTPAEVVRLAELIAVPAPRTSEATKVQERRYGLLVLFLAWTGCRFSEAIGMRRADVDMLRKRVRVFEPMKDAGKGGRYHGRPKTRKSARWIELPPFLVARLAEHLAHPHDYVWPSRTGATPIWYATFHGRFAKAIAKVHPDATIHSLRHSHITWLREARCHERTIDERVGHAGGGVRARYTHSTPATRAEVLKVLEDHWREANGLPTTKAVGS